MRTLDYTLLNEMQLGQPKSKVEKLAAGKCIEQYPE